MSSQAAETEERVHVGATEPDSSVDLSLTLEEARMLRSVAQRGLWREAIYRWEKATQIDPTYAAAFNDLAIGYEHEGQLDKARKAYERALELDPNNSQVRQNYELFKEINDRTAQKEK